MDGEAITNAFSEQSGTDCLKDVIPKFGQRIKVYKALKTALGEAIVLEVWSSSNYCSPHVSIAAR